MGVVDDDFIKKLPNLKNLLNRKYPLSLKDVQTFLGLISDLGNLIESEVKKHYT